jgi:putative aminopeptidase FrvX
MNPLDLLQDLIALPGPPGQEDAVRGYLEQQLEALGLGSEVDPKGNLLVKFGEAPRVIVTAHMDEIALQVTEIEPDATLKVTPMGGLHPWKLGEGPVRVLGRRTVLGVVGFGAAHTDDPRSRSTQAKQDGPAWPLTRVVTGHTIAELEALGIGPGTRVVSDQRRLRRLAHGLVAGRFLDDRADLVAWLLALDSLRESPLGGVWFAATVAEEVGGEGAQYLLHRTQPDVCIALELGPHVPDAPVALDGPPTLWVSDSYAAMHASDIARVEAVGKVQRQALSRGGSDASCSAAKGLCARPITLGIPMENTHGFEIIHQDSMDKLANLTLALLKNLLP